MREADSRASSAFVNFLCQSEYWSAVPEVIPPIKLPEGGSINSPPVGLRELLGLGRTYIIFKSGDR
jgi:hypothetical protein